VRPGVPPPSSGRTNSIPFSALAWILKKECSATEIQVRGIIGCLNEIWKNVIFFPACNNHTVDLLRDPDEIGGIVGTWNQ